MWIFIFGILTLFGIGVLAFLLTKNSAKNAVKSVADDCCGAHEVCEKTSLLNASETVIYYDDEELDELADLSAEALSDEQYAKVEEVFFSLREDDVAGWLRSLQLRRIALPEEIRQKALLIISERRFGEK